MYMKHENRLWHTTFSSCVLVLFLFAIEKGSTSRSATCSLIGGVVHIAWHPHIDNLSPNGSVEQAKFCFHDKDHCFTVCEAKFFANGTLRMQSRQKEIIDYCKKPHGFCRIAPSNVTLNHVTWSSRTQTLSCTLFRTCMYYKSHFSVMGYASSATGRDDRKKSDFVICPYQNYEKFKPATPFDVHVTDVKSEEITFSWKLSRCGTDLFETDVYVLVNGVKVSEVVDYRRDVNGINNVYSYTKRRLKPHQTLEVQITTERRYPSSFSKKYTSKTTVYTYTTRPSAPGKEPHLKNVRYVGDKLKLDWKNPNPLDLNGEPNETRIVGMKDGKTVYNDVRYGKQRTSALLKVNPTQRCARFQVKICNAPNLCSNFSNGRRANKCLNQYPNTTPTNDVPSTSPRDAHVLWIIPVCLVLLVIICAVIVYFWYQQKKMKARPKLPKLKEEQERTGGYIPVGQLSQLGQYHSLNEEPKERSIKSSDC